MSNRYENIDGLANVDHEHANNGEEVNGNTADPNNKALDDEQAAADEEAEQLKQDRDIWPTISHAYSVESILDLLHPYEPQQPLQIECDDTADEDLVSSEESDTETAYDTAVFGITDTDVTQWHNNNSNTNFGNNHTEEAAAAMPTAELTTTDTDLSQLSEIAARWIAAGGFYYTGDFDEFESELRFQAFQRFLRLYAQRVALAIQLRAERDAFEAQLLHQNIILEPLPLPLLNASVLEHYENEAEELLPYQQAADEYTYRNASTGNEPNE